MKLILPFLLKALLLLVPVFAMNWAYAQTTPNANGILFVKKGSSGNGSAWGNALGEVSEALKAASLLNAATVGTVKEIWVAKGTYLPAYPVNDVASGAATNTNRYNSFLLVKDTKLYGGFAGNETSIIGRDFVANTTILSGDIGAAGTKSDNVYRVVVAAGEMGEALISGFTISDGYAQVSGNVVVNGVNSNIEQGAGITVRSAKLLIEDVILTNNYNNNGAGAACYAGNGEVMADATFRRVNFYKNSGLVSGAGLYAIYAKVQIENSTGSFNKISGSVSANGGMFALGQSATVDCQQSNFFNNTSSLNGAAISILGTAVAKFSNCEINDNKAGSIGGGIYATGNSITTFDKCKFLRDTSVSYSGGFYAGNSAVIRFESSVIKGCFTDSYTAAGYVNGVSCIVTFLNSQVTGNYNANTNDFGTIRVGGGTLNVINSTFSGNNRSAIATAVSSLNIFNSVIYGNAAGVTGVGSYTATNSIIQGVTPNAANKLTNVDPLFVSSPLHTTAPFVGGNYSLQLGSPGINVGDNSRFPGLDATTLDLLGNARVQDYANGGIIDIGAYEYTLILQSINPITDMAKVFGDADFEPGAMATSGLKVAYTSSDDNIAQAYEDAADGNKWKIKVKKAGSVNITASQSGNQTYAIATNVVFALSIDKALQTISFPIFGAKNTSDVDFEPMALANTGLALTFSSSHTTVANVYQDAADGNQWKIKIIGPGQTEITAVQAGNSNYHSASMSRTLTVTPVTLPVVLKDFTAKREGNRARLEWTTTSELNNALFTIKKSINGVDFIEVGTLNGHGTTAFGSNYIWEDTRPSNGTNYYQLLQKDHNGVVKELGLKTVDFAISDALTLTVYPNPVVRELKLDFSPGAEKLELLDINGKKLREVLVDGKSVSLKMDVSGLPSGIYFIRLKGSVNLVKKIVKL